MYGMCEHKPSCTVHGCVSVFVRVCACACAYVQMEINVYECDSEGTKMKVSYHYPKSQ